jgi:myo-inositol 2-dehydrogenase / D-chiro-inositol 1-dehydrogenase
MPPIQLNRRRFLSCSAAAGWVLTQGMPADAGMSDRPIRIGMIGLGNRGTTLLRACLEVPNAEVVAACDVEPKHLARAAGIVEKARGRKLDLLESADRLLERPEIDAVVVALPCDLHAGIYEKALKAGKHLYAEKPLGLTVAECDRLIAEAARRPAQAVHVGFQRRSNPRYRDGIAAIRRGDLGLLLSGSGAWISSNGPISGHDGWLARRDRSGDWMVEQAVHVWDVFHWVAGGLPSRAYGSGRRDVFTREQPGRDMTDDYQASLRWDDGFAVNFVQSWAAPADDGFPGISLRVLGTEGGLDFTSGALTFRDRKRPRQVLHPGSQPDTNWSILAFLAAARSLEPVEPPVGLVEAREATVTGLMVRRAVDEGRVVERQEVLASG